MRIGMLPYWKDEEAPHRLETAKAIREYTWDEEAEEAFQELLDEEIREDIVRRVPHTMVKFLNPVFMVPKPKKKGEKKKRFRKVTDCRWINAEQIYIHFKMQGPETVQDVALPGDQATSIDLENAFMNMIVSEEFRPFLCFSHKGSYYMYMAMPFGARHSPRIFTRALG